MTESPPSATRRSAAGRHAAVIALFALVTLVFFSGLLSGRTYAEVGRFQRIVYPWGSPSTAASPPRIIHYDQVKSYYPWQVFINDSLRGGEIPLWNPYSFAGTPFLAANANNVLYPPRVGLSRVVSPARVHDLLVASHMFLAGLAMYLLLLYWRSSFAGAILGAIAWMANSFMLAWAALEHFVVVAALLPVAVLLVDASIRRRSWAASIALGPVLALLVLGGNILFVELSFVVVGGFGVALVAERAIIAARRHELRRRRSVLAADTARLVVPWLLGIGLSAITLLPTAELVRESARAPLSYRQLQDLGLPLSELGNVFVAPDLDETSFLRDPYHAALFGGTLVGLLALVGFGVRRRGAWLARALVLVTMLVALGTPLLALPYWFLPGFANLKPLGRVLFLFAFAVAVLAAFGLDALSSWLRRSVPGQRAALLAALIPVAAIGVTVVQLRVYASDILRSQDAGREHLYPVTPLLERLREDAGSRLLPAGGVLPGSTALVYPLRSALGYESIVPARVQDFWRVVSGVPVPELAAAPVQSAFEPAPRLDELRLDLLERAGVDHLVAPPGLEPGAREAERLATIYDGPDGRAFWLRRALPRAYVVTSCEPVRDAQSALVRFQEGGFDPRTSVILEEAGLRSARLDCRRTQAAPGGVARIVSERINGLTVELDSAKAGFLVVNDSWDPGWRAAVDGREAPVLAANFAFRAIPVDEGRHTVQLRYSPRAYEAGAWITGVTLLLAAAAFAVLMLRRPRVSRPVETTGATTSPQRRGDV